MIYLHLVVAEHECLVIKPFVDARALQIPYQPEMRGYYARYFDGKEDIGDMSAIKTIIYSS